MSERFKIGDRVTIEDVRDRYARDYVGRVGTVTMAFHVVGSYSVLLEHESEIVIATRVRSADKPTLASAQAAVAATTGVKVGDRVRIVQTIDNSSRSRAVVGMVGRLEDIYPAFTSGKVYTVWLGGQLYAATKVEPAPADTPSPSDPTPVLDPRRVAAAREAVSILWDGAEEVDVELLAEWLLNERPVATAKPVREPIDDQTFTGWYERLGAQPARSFFITNASDPDPTSKPDADETAQELEKAKVLTDSVLTLGDLEVDFDDTSDDDVVLIYTDGSEYLGVDQVDELITYLQAAKRVHQSQQAERDI